jgi:hypothetical protein
VIGSSPWGELLFDKDCVEGGAKSRAVVGGCKVTGEPGEPKLPVSELVRMAVGLEAVPVGILAPSLLATFAEVGDGESSLPASPPTPVNSGSEDASGTFPTSLKLVCAVEAL